MKALQNLAFRPGLPARLVSVFILPVLFAGCLSEEERVLPGDVDKTPTVKSSTAAVGAITVADLLDEMHDLERLARLEKHPFRTVQYSSYDRRSRSPDGEAWFSNADGFGREPIPGFEAVLAEADGEGTGSYLLCDVTGPGVIVRGWSMTTCSGLLSSAMRCTPLIVPLVLRKQT